MTSPDHIEPADISGCLSPDLRVNKPSSRERRQQTILDAAESLFIEQGFDRTRLSEIVQRSGGSLATLYELFGNKQGLLNALAIRWRDEMMKERNGREFLSGRSKLEILMGYIRNERELWQSPRTVALMRMLASECLRDRGFALQIYRNLHLPFIAQLSGLFAEWAAAGDVRIDDPDAAAYLFQSTISGDTMLNRLFGLEEGIPNEAQIRWRLKPFLEHFGIA